MLTPWGPAAFWQHELLLAAEGKSCVALKHLTASHPFISNCPGDLLWGYGPQAEA